VVAPYVSGVPSPPVFLENSARVQPGPTRRHGTVAWDPVCPAVSTVPFAAGSGAATAGTASPTVAAAAAVTAARPIARRPRKLVPILIVLNLTSLVRGSMAAVFMG
jgi:hypothetical protein